MLQWGISVMLRNCPLHKCEIYCHNQAVMTMFLVKAVTTVTVVKQALIQLLLVAAEVSHTMRPVIGKMTTLPVEVVVFLVVEVEVEVEIQEQHHFTDHSLHIRRLPVEHHNSVGKVLKELWPSLRLLTETKQ